jgi:hypothetical protein
VAGLPLTLADRAIELGLACELSDPRRKKLSGVIGLAAPALAHCVSLDGTPTTTEPKTSGPVEPIKSSHFEVVDRGPPIVGTLPAVRPAEPMAATRSATPDEEG